MLKIYNDIGLTALPLNPDGMPAEPDDPCFAAPPRYFLCCVAERDLATLLPLLPQLRQRLPQASVAARRSPV
jgi:hypothetical protein